MYHSPKQTISTFLKVFVRAKNRYPCRFLLAYFCLLVGFALICVFVRSIFFIKKKSKQDWDCLNSLISLYYFQDTPSYSGTKISKKACVKENEHVYVFSLRISMLWKFLFLISDKVKWLPWWCICEVEVSQLIWLHF